MPKEYIPVNVYSLVPETRYYIVPNARLAEKKLVGKPIPEEKADKIFLLSGVYGGKATGYTDAVKFNDYQKRDGTLHKTPGVPTSKTHSFFNFEPIENKLKVTSENIAKTHGVAVEEEASAAATEEAAAAATDPKTAAAARIKATIKKSTDELLDILINGPGRHTIETIFERKNPPEVNVTNIYHQYAPGTGYLLKPEQRRFLNENSIYYILPFAKKLEDVFSEYGVLEYLLIYPRYLPDDKLYYADFLLSKGADPSKALITAVVHQNLEMVKILLEKGADPNTINVYTTSTDDRFTRTALDVAVPNMHWRIADKLSKINCEKMENIVDEILKARRFKFQEDKVVPTTNESDGFLVEANVTKDMINEMKQKLEKAIADSKLPGSVPKERDLVEFVNSVNRIIKKMEDRFTEISLRPGGEGAVAAGRNFQNAAATAATAAIGGSRKITKVKRKRTRRSKL